jgi:5-deoxy-D-glucuronate isomerase
MPSLARPGEEIKVINLDPKSETVIRVYTADGMLQETYTVSEADMYTLRAGYTNGFYLVEVVSDSMKSTLRYIVK